MHPDQVPLPLEVHHEVATECAAHCYCVVVQLAAILDDKSSGVCAAAELEDREVEELRLRWRDANLEP